MVRVNGRKGLAPELYLERLDARTREEEGVEQEVNNEGAPDQEEGGQQLSSELFIE